MDTTSLPVLLAFTSLLLGVVAVVIFAYVVLPKRRRAKAKATEAPAPVATPTPPPADAPPPAPTKRTGKVKQHSLFVIFNQPDDTTDARLTEWLRSKGAHYDAIKKVFLIDGQQASNPITVANAFPPGEMPDLLRGETHEPIRGVSLLVKPPLHKRRNQQMHVYVELAKEMNETFSGDMLDADREPASESTYAQIIG
ncbi:MULTISPECIES: cell division protein ZipA C-terminal FtsZ-binding domain-containing protein [Halomonadaceae]|uniref:cell division protein ZipA C-terminal FtsZ-binding domain-containing protein n=1 Tax=Halomonadaceae TaxID=28256 RepID=UPI001C627527|nr:MULTISPECIES: cell division protein ZipA C-terminal FtsZ-binding domain-containing protein [Halomonas]MCG7590397.1 cell division protein ZipA C-terminal FtsZ-binding domain-containing protein [Halomonas sp. McD50-5]MCG7616509.1 cell division protein ZipA C-terminal FtsZ-binding domain-containing protein [Halomonas sp. McD50-4]